MMPFPPHLEFLKVDDVIEAIEYSYSHITTERWHAIERELLDRAPYAYCGNGVPLRRVWYELEDATQYEIFIAYRADYLSEETDDAV